MALPEKAADEATQLLGASHVEISKSGASTANDVFEGCRVQKKNAGRLRRDARRVDPNQLRGGTPLVHRADGLLRHGFESKVALAFVAVESLVTAFKLTSFTKLAKSCHSQCRVALR